MHIFIFKAIFLSFLLLICNVYYVKESCRVNPNRFKANGMGAHKKLFDQPTCPWLDHFLFMEFRVDIWWINKGLLQLSNALRIIEFGVRSWELWALKVRLWMQNRFPALIFFIIAFYPSSISLSPFLEKCSCSPKWLNFEELNDLIFCPGNVYQ